MTDAPNISISKQLILQIRIRNIYVMAFCFTIKYY